MTLELSPSKVGQWTDTVALHPDAPGFALPVSLWRVIARGSSLTYEGFDRRVGARVCVKLAAHARDGAARDHVLTQAALYANVEHTSLAPVLDTGSLSDGTPYIVSEFVSGQTLTELMRKAPVGTALACEVTNQLLGALGALHRAGLVLGHLSADLVFVDFTPDGRRRVRLLDSGFGRPMGSTEGGPLYLAPELLAGGAGPSARSDLYALGLLLHEMLTGTCPHAGCASNELAATRLRQDIGDTALLRAGVSSALARVVVSALARDPEVRFASADEMLCELLAARADDSCLWRLPSDPAAGRAGVQEVSNLVLPLPSAAPPQSPLDSAVWTPDLSQTLDLAPPRSRGWKAMLVGFGVTLSAGAALLLPLESSLKSAEPAAEHAPGPTESGAATHSTQPAALKAEPAQLPAAHASAPPTQSPRSPEPAAAPVAPIRQVANPASAEAERAAAGGVPDVAPSPRQASARSPSLPVQRPGAQQLRSLRAKNEPASSVGRSSRSRPRRSIEPTDLPANPY
jgi:serine/threonine protein kinase